MNAPDDRAYRKRLNNREWAPLPQRVVPELLLEADLGRLKAWMVGRMKIDTRYGGPSDDDLLLQAALIQIIDLIQEKGARRR